MRPPGRRGADTIVSYFDVRVSVNPPDGHRGRVRVGVLGDVGQRLGDHEVGRGLDRLGQPLARDLDDLDRQRRAHGERLDGGLQPAVGEHGRVDPAGELAQLLERTRELLLRGGDHLARPVGGLADLVLGDPKGEAERDEALLGAVVQVALQPPPLLHAGLHDPRAGAAQGGLEAL
jgi:hypothetical protein